MNTKIDKPHILSTARDWRRSEGFLNGQHCLTIHQVATWVISDLKSVSDKYYYANSMLHHYKDAFTHLRWAIEEYYPDIILMEKPRMNQVEITTWRLLGYPVCCNCDYPIFNGDCEHDYGKTHVNCDEPFEPIRIKT